MERQHPLLLFYQVHSKRVLYAFFGKYRTAVSVITNELILAKIASCGSSW